MDMTKKQILTVCAAAIAIALIFIWLFALPISVGSHTVQINTLSQSAYEKTIVPYFLDTSSSNYMDNVSHFIDDYSPDRSGEEYSEIFILFDLRKFTPVPFRSLWVGVDSIPDEYKNYVVCVTTGPLMTDNVKTKNQGSITLLVRRQDLTDEQLLQLADAVKYRIKWSLAMGIDGNIHT